MTLSRRTFVRTLSLGGAGVLGAPLLAGRGSEAWGRALGVGDELPGVGAPRAMAASPLRLNSNENPYGPSPAALRAVQGALTGASRYPREWEDALAAALAAEHGVKVENILLGAGSGEVLRMAAFAFLSPTAALVTAAPSFEDSTHYAEGMGAPVHAVPVTGNLQLDLAAMAARCPGAGLVFLCNPNNPTSTVHSAAAVADFVAGVRRSAPGTTIVIDEAYHEYVEDPAYATSIPMALADPRVVVARTFSKVFGMAGLRVGYAIGTAETLKTMRRHRLGNSVNVLGAAGAVAALGERAFLAEQRRLNREARAYTHRAFTDAGFAVVPSQTNFLMIDIRRDAREFQVACRKHDVLVGRPFPPLNTHTRISIGTMEEMRRAVPVFRTVLAG